MPHNLESVLVPTALLVACSCASVSSTTPVSSQGTAPEPWTSRLIDPVSSPTTFETPVVHSSIEPVYMHQSFPSDSIFDGGGFDVYAVQLRYALNDRFGIIATKDGYIDIDPDEGESEDGWADIGGGIKYVAYEDRDAGVLVTPGLYYEATNGSDDVFQGNGDGIIRPFISAGVDRDRWNFLCNAGYNFPLDDDEESTSFDYHFHCSYEATPQIIPLFEVNGITYTDDGDALPVDFEGGDLINLGADDVDGNTIVTGAFGGRYKINDRFHFGVTYEVPFTDRDDLFDDRFTVDMLIYF